jgi:flagellar P-ring protein FlgI
MSCQTQTLSAPLARRRALTRAITALSLAMSLIAGSARAEGVRLKDLADVEGVRDNALVGYGLVVGLSGTGDTERVLFTQQSLSGMLGRLGIRIDPRDVRVRNVAAVMVTARLPAYVRSGARLDVEVSAIGNARSLAGGTLLMTPLRGPDGEVYALAQGAVQVGGFDVGAAGSRISKNQPGAGRVPNGATVEQSVAPSLDDGPVVLALREPDFTTAVRVAAAVNAALGEGRARAVDAASIEVTLAEETGPAVAVLSQLEGLRVDADRRARIVISERTGTIVAGADVRLRPVMVAHGGLRISVDTAPVISQPAPFARVGETAVQQRAGLLAEEQASAAVALPASTTVDELAQALNTLGVPPRDLIVILEAIKRAGALDAEIVVV